jgi:diaminopimelate decarboxylase
VVGRSGVTLYSVVTVKRGARTHVAVDGGMADNLEYPLYRQRFAPRILDTERPPEALVLVGMHCETGDILAEQVELAAPQVGDIVLMPVTGAYAYSLQNNYNGVPRPPVILVNDGRARLAVRRERIDELMSRDVA